MKQYTLNRSSWHYWVVKTFTDFYGGETDICTYMRYVAKGLFLGAISIFVALALCAFFGYGTFSLMSSIFLGERLNTPALAIALIIVGIVLITIWHYFKSCISMNTHESEPGFINLAYAKLKNKTCAKINFK